MIANAAVHLHGHYSLCYLYKVTSTGVLTLEDKYMCTYLSTIVLTFVFEMSHGTHIIHGYQRVKYHSTTGVTCHGG